MEMGREGRIVSYEGSLYHFRTVEQAAGFFRGIQEGKTLEFCRDRWRPSMVRVAAGAPQCQADCPSQPDARRQ